MPASPSLPHVRPALESDLTTLQDLARRTIAASYRTFLGNEAVDWFIDSGASDAHIAKHFRQGGLHRMKRTGRPSGCSSWTGPPSTS